VECADLEVPLDHDHPDGWRITLGLARVPATDGASRLGSVLINPGGPGASGVELVLGGFRLDARTMAHYDLVGFDPRGVGRSEALRCEPDLVSQPLPDPSPDTPAEVDQLDRQARAIAERCAETDGDRLAFLGSDSVARDLDLLREALGDDRLNYYGLSYGTLLGLRYLERFPERAGRIVLDGVVDPEADLAVLLRQQAVAVERVFGEEAAACAQRSDCPPGGLLAAFDEALRLVEDAPVDGAGPAEVATAGFLSTYDPGFWQPLARALGDAVADGDLTMLDRLSDLYHGSAAFAPYAAVTCSDTPVPRGPAAWDALVDELTRASPRFGPALGNELRTCAYWPVSTDRPPRAVRAAGSGPVLVIGTTGDAATPLDNAVRVSRQLANGHLLVHDGAGHTAVGDPCVDEVVGRFLVDGELPAADERCS
jgi:pimeloyl-ACP methyl ester carboxylesterase